jgi:hypothetical protein
MVNANSEKKVSRSAPGKAITKTFFIKFIIKFFRLLYQSIKIAS